MRIRRPDDFHVHLRDGDMMKKVLPETAWTFARALLMPNLYPEPVTTAHGVVAYKSRVLQSHADEIRSHFDFHPLMSIAITPETTPAIVREAWRVGTFAAKLYPKGVTTNSSHGVTIEDIKRLESVWDEMSEVGMVLCVHAEHPDEDVDGFDKEIEFLDRVADPLLMNPFRKLKVVIEHISSADSVDFVRTAGVNVAATITLHHLLMCHDDFAGYSKESGGFAQPHLACKPVLKRQIDRDALMAAVTVPNSSKFFFGSDSAPHPREKKESAHCPCGVFSAPVLIPLLTEFFDREGQCFFEPFVSEYGANFYGLPINEGTIEIVEDPWVVPPEIGGIVPFFAGRTLKYKVI